jgi:hypothetical protein
VIRPFARGLVAASLLQFAAPDAAFASMAKARTAADCTPAVELLEPSLLSGPWHRVDACVEFVGHMARFKLYSPFGDQAVDSVELLKLRIDEMPAVAALERTNIAVFGAKAAGTEAYERGANVAHVVSRPVETAKNLPNGVLRFFRKRYDKYANRARKYGGRARDEMTGADEAYVAPSVRPGVGRIENGPSHNAGDKLAKELRNQALDYVAYKSTRRKWSKRLGLDPHTTNPLVRERLDRLTWAAVAGEQAVDLAFAALPGDVLDALGTARDLREYALDPPPEDVKRMNAERLADLGCSPVETQRFVQRGRFSPVLQTSLVDALVDIQPTHGCNDVIELATALRGEIEARYLVNALRLLADDAGPAARLELIGTSIVLRGEDSSLTSADETWDGRTLTHSQTTARASDSIKLPLAVDRLEWTPATRAFFDSPALRIEHKTALVSGELSPRSRRELTRRGWEVRELLAGDGLAVAQESAETL